MGSPAAGFSKTRPRKTLFSAQWSPRTHADYKASPPKVPEGGNVAKGKAVRWCWAIHESSKSPFFTTLILLTSSNSSTWSLSNLPSKASAPCFNLYSISSRYIGITLWKNMVLSLLILSLYAFSGRRLGVDNNEQHNFVFFAKGFIGFSFGIVCMFHIQVLYSCGNRARNLRHLKGQ